jgi:hypothetical protein
MNQSFFIFILILVLGFSVFNAGYEKRHNDESVLKQEKVKKTIENATIIDGIVRIFTDISVFFG